MFGIQKIIILLSCYGLFPFTVQAEIAEHSVIFFAERVQNILRSLEVTDPAHMPVQLSLIQKITQSSRQQLLQNQLKVIVKPGRIVPSQSNILLVRGERLILPMMEGQRSCTAIQADWLLLDAIYDQVSRLAGKLNMIYTEAEFCASCADHFLEALRRAGVELETISLRLHQDGQRLVALIWMPQAFVQDRIEYFMELKWENLVYYNIDGDSQLADPGRSLPKPPQLVIGNSILKNGIHFQLETSADRACSPELDIRFDGTGMASVFAERNTRRFPISLILISP